MHAKLFLACFALGGLVSCAASVKTEPAPAPAVAQSAENSDPHVGKDYWSTSYALTLLSQPGSGQKYEFLSVGTHFKIDGVQQGEGRNFYHAVLDNGQAGYLEVALFSGRATDVDPAVTAAECRRRGDPHIGMSAKQVEATCWGKPDYVNTTERKSGLYQQFVYGDNKFVYLRNGVVTSVNVKRR